MADWTAIDTNSLLPGEPWTTTKAQASFENVEAAAQGASGAPVWEVSWHHLETVTQETSTTGDIIFASDLTNFRAIKLLGNMTSFGGPGSLDIRLTRTGGGFAAITIDIPTGGLTHDFEAVLENIDDGDGALGRVFGRIVGTNLATTLPVTVTVTGQVYNGLKLVTDGVSVSGVWSLYGIKRTQA